MNSKQTKWLVGLALALLAFIVAVELRRPDLATSTPGGTLVPQLRPATVTRVELTRSNATFRAERAGGQWRLTAPLNYPANDLALNALLDVCSKLRPRQHVTGAEATRLVDFGLQPPQATVLFQQGGQPVELRIGARTAVNDLLYVQVAGSDHIAITDAKLLELLPLTADAWRDRRLLSLTGLKFDRLRVRNGTRDLVAQRGTNRLWRIEEPKPVKRANTPRLDQLLTELQRWPVQRFVTDDPKAELDSFGLQPSEMELAFGAGTNDLLTVQFGKSPTNQPGLVYARSLATTNVMLVARDWLEQLRAPVWDFTEHRLVDALVPGGVDTIQVQAKEPFTLRLRTNAAAELVWVADDKAQTPTDPVMMESFLANLVTLEAVELEKDVVTDYAPYGLATPERSVSLLRSGTNSAGTLTNTLMARLDFGKTKGNDTVFARRHDENSIYVVPRGDVENFAWSLFQLQDRTVWSFATNQVSALSVQWDGQNHRLTRAVNGRWSEGTNTLDELRSVALEETCFRLGQLRAARWVFLAEGAADTKRLSLYGIGPDSRSVSIELAGQPARTNVLTFGHMPSKRNPWASAPDPRSGQPAVFEFPRELFLHYIVQYLSQVK